MRASLIALSLLFILASGCATTQTQTGTHGAPPIAYSEQGLASWYGPELAKGTPTASGERYRDSDYTAAHKKLPFGTRVLVENLKNGRRVVVRITDRGPYGRGRIIDLSGAAARAIRMIDAGVVPVKLVVVP